MLGFETFVSQRRVEAACQVKQEATQPQPQPRAAVAQQVCIRHTGRIVHFNLSFQQAQPPPPQFDPFRFARIAIIPEEEVQASRNYIVLDDDEQKNRPKRRYFFLLSPNYITYFLVLQEEVFTLKKKEIL